jgi:nucleotide-binding universal stress UspA family protein
MMMPPTLRWALGRLPLNAEERRRLEHESFEERGFVANLERLLLAADETNEGKFAARIVGLLASTHGSPVTLLQMRGDKEEADREKDKDNKAGDKAPEKPDEDRQDEPLKTIIAGGGLPARVGSDDAAKAAEPIHVTTVLVDKVGGEEVTAEAENGYDLLAISLPAAAGEGGGFEPQIQNIANAFTGALAIISARGRHREHPISTPLNILLPVNGSAASRRGADVAFALAHALGCPLYALYVRAVPPERRSQLLDAAQRDQAAVLNDLENLAKHYEVELKTAIRTGLAPEVAILREVRSRKSTLVIMGVSRRSAEILSFGAVADAVLEALDRSLILVSGE